MYLPMKIKNLLTALLVIIAMPLYSQNRSTYRSGISAEENLRAISDISPTSGGGMGFDTRYKGVKGSPMLFDTLQSSYLKITGQEKYLMLDSDIDLINNAVRFIHPSTKQVMAVPASRVEELIISRGDSDLVFRIMNGSLLKRKTNDPVFYQVLNDDSFKLLRVPVKEFMEANYKQLYSPGRNYDEFYTVNKYFILTNDGSVLQCQLSEKSLIKLFPQKKEMIKKIAGEKNFDNKAQMVTEILKSF